MLRRTTSVPLFCHCLPFPLQTHQALKDNLDNINAKMKEIWTTEITYTRNLEGLVDGYQRASLAAGEAKLKRSPYQVSIPDNLTQGHFKIIFGNVEQIFQFHKR